MTHLCLVGTIFPKRDVIFSAVISRVQKRTHKYGIDVKTYLKYAIYLDKKNGNTLWQDATSKEMYNMPITFKILPTGERAPPRCKKIIGHIVYNFNMDFT